MLGTALTTFTCVPPAGAARVKVTVTSGASPAGTEAGLTVIAFTAIGCSGGLAMVSVADLGAAEPDAAVIVADPGEADAFVRISTVALVEPAATVVVGGTGTSGFEEERFTVVPPAGAGAVRLTAMVVPAPRSTVVGLRVIEAISTGLATIVSDAVLGVPEPIFAAIAALTLLAGLSVEMLNAALVEPDGTSAFDTRAAGCDDTIVTVVPPCGAAPLSVTIPVTFCPPDTLDGFNVIALTPRGAASATSAVLAAVTSNEALFLAPP